MSYAIAVLALLAVIGLGIVLQRRRDAKAVAEMAPLVAEIEAAKAAQADADAQWTARLVAEELPPVPRKPKPKKSVPKAVPPKPKPRSHHAKTN